MTSGVFRLMLLMGVGITPWVCASSWCFPEIEYDKIDKLRGLEISIVTTARNDDEARQLLQMLGMPFQEGRLTNGEKVHDYT